jgi:hypothetical protein
MLKLEAIQKDAQIAGLDPNGIVRVVSVEPVGTEAVTVYFKGSDGKLAEQMLFRTDEARLSLAEAGRAWAFDAPADGFKLGLKTTTFPTELGCGPVRMHRKIAGRRVVDNFRASAGPKIKRTQPEASE